MENIFCLANTVLILVSKVVSSSSEMKSMCRCVVCGSAALVTFEMRIVGLFLKEKK